MRLLFIIYMLFVFSGVSLAQSTPGWELVDQQKGLVKSKELNRKLQIASEYAEVQGIITRYFFSKGYLTARVDSASNRTIYITRGCLFSVGSTSIVHSIPYDNYTPSLALNDIFTEEKLQFTISEITDVAESQGYPFAQVTVSDLNVDNNQCKVDITYNVNEGPKWIASDIFFSKTDRVGANYLKKISGYKDSVIITQPWLNAIQRNLLNTNYFSSVSDPGLVETDEGKFIYVELRERNPNYFDGLVGYVPDPSGTGQVVGEAKLGLVNTVSDGSELNLLFQRLRPENTRLNIGFSQDWISNIPVGIGTEFKFFQQDTNYQARSFSMNSYYQVNPRLRVLMQLKTSVTTANDESAISATEVDGSRQLASLGFEYSSLNRPLVPTWGIRYSLLVGTGRKAIAPDDASLQLNRRRVRQRELTSTFELYIPLKLKQVLAVKGFGYFIDAPFYTEVDLFRFGGANSFRGYSEEQFIASRAGWGELEYRYLLNNNSYLFTFGTAGGFYRPSLITELSEQLSRSDFLYSFGFGLSYLTNIGQLKFSYGLSPQDELSNGKVHFGIVTAL